MNLKTFRVDQGYHYIAINMAYNTKNYLEKSLPEQEE